MGAPRKPRPTEEEMKIAIQQSMNNNNRPQAAYKPPENIAEIRQQTPILLDAIDNHGRKEFKTRKGRKPYFESADELQDHIDQYLDMCKAMNAPPTIGLLAEWLGCGYPCLCDWEKDESNPLSQTVKRVKARIASTKLYMAETKQTSENITMFGLKTQHGFVETQYINLTAQPGKAPDKAVDDDEFSRQAMEATRLIESGAIEITPDGKVK